MQELHDECNLAHLDIRLANICLTHTQSLGIKLIDLDRSLPASQPFALSEVRTYADSVMYKGNDAWTLSHIDWRQLGIMV